MRSSEEKVGDGSDYYIYSPSKTAQSTFFYLTYTGHFYYENNYHLKRKSFDSFLLMYILNGSLHAGQEEFLKTAKEGQFLLLDCYKAHEYYTTEPCETIWLHFDGICARPFYELITSRVGNLFSMENPSDALNKLNRIYQVFASGAPVQEARLSKYINDILTEFILDTSSVKTENDCASIIEDTVFYISQHFKDSLSIGFLADMASLSPYYFIRIFKEETGFTPHDYIVNLRINTAKYLLTNTALPIKEICFQAGFSSESVFSSAFKKKVRQSPSVYRSKTK